MKKLICLLAVALLSVFALTGCGGSSGGSSSSSSKEVSYAKADLSVLMNELEGNAAAASKNYKGKDVKVTGIVSNIDSEGNYFNIKPAGSKFTIQSMQCFIKDKKLKDEITKLKKKAPVTVYGHISDVGEVLGYSLDTKKIELPK